IENIDACLNFLAAKGINIQGLSAEEIRNGNLKAILGLFFSLSRYKQQQQQPQKQHLSSPLPPAVSQAAGAPFQCQAGTPQQQVPATPQALCQPHQPAPHQQSKAQAEMQSSASSKDSSQSKIIRFTLGQKKISRLPGPTTRVSAAGSDAKTRGGSAAANNRRSQSFNNYDKSKPVTSPPPPPSSHEKVKTVIQPLASAASKPFFFFSLFPPTSPPLPALLSSQCPIPQTSSERKGWRPDPVKINCISLWLVLQLRYGPLSDEVCDIISSPVPHTCKSPLVIIYKFSSDYSKQSPEMGDGRKAILHPKFLSSFHEVTKHTGFTGHIALSDGRPVGASCQCASCGSAIYSFSGFLYNFKRSPSGMKRSRNHQRAEVEAGFLEFASKAAEKRISGPPLPLLPSSSDGMVPGVETEPPLSGNPKSEAAPVPGLGILNDRSRLERVSPSPAALWVSGKQRHSFTESFLPLPGVREATKMTFSIPPSKSVLDSEFSEGRSTLLGEVGEGSGGAAFCRGLSHHCCSAPRGEGRTLWSPSLSALIPPEKSSNPYPSCAQLGNFVPSFSTRTVQSITGKTACSSLSLKPSSSKTPKGEPECCFTLEMVTGEDPEARRLRTVKNIADLRQNLEETMSSLRGTQVTHSTLETTFDTNVTTEVSGRSILSLTGRPTPLSWRLGQSSPRLQAGDAPSMGNGYPPRANASRFINTESGRYVYPAPLRRQLASRGSSVCHVDVSDKAGDEMDLEGLSVDAPGYMSDGDVLSKNIRTDDITSGYMTDGGLGLYTRRLNRLPDGMAVVRETLQRNTSLGLGDADR
uniref:Calponin-homology (CH) domain-containing protein n=1 Tax=Myotis lucifugus TaxID=59463 RepID=G1QFM6_MYOLU